MPYLMDVDRQHKPIDFRNEKEAIESQTENNSFDSVQKQ